MIEKTFSYIVCILILCIGVYVVVRPVFVSEKIKKFYSNYPIIRYAGDKQLTSRSCFVRFLGIILIIIGLFGVIGNFMVKS